MYRAPEVLSQLGGFSSKSDIWALGCIMYELCTKEKAFLSDWEIGEWARSIDRSQKRITTIEHSKDRGMQSVLTAVQDLSSICIEASIKVEWTLRPSASELHSFSDSFETYFIV